MGNFDFTRGLVLAVVMMMAAGCGLGGSATPLPITSTSLTTEEGDYPVDGTVELTLFNSTTTQSGYNLCASRLERSTLSGWTTAPESARPSRDCTFELGTLGGRQSGSQSVEGPHEPGPIASSQASPTARSQKTARATASPFTDRAARW